MLKQNSNCRNKNKAILFTLDQILLVYEFTYSRWSDSKLALSIYQAVLNHCKEARISICSTDANYGGA